MLKGCLTRINTGLITEVGRELGNSVNVKSCTGAAGITDRSTKWPTKHRQKQRRKRISELRSRKTSNQCATATKTDQRQYLCREGNIRRKSLVFLRKPGHCTPQWSIHWDFSRKSGFYVFNFLASGGTGTGKSTAETQRALKMLLP